MKAPIINNNKLITDLFTHIISNFNLVSFEANSHSSLSTSSYTFVLSFGGGSNRIHCGLSVDHHLKVLSRTFKPNGNAGISIADSNLRKLLELTDYINSVRDGLDLS